MKLANLDYLCDLVPHKEAEKVSGDMTFLEKENGVKLNIWRIVLFL